MRAWFALPAAALALAGVAGCPGAGPSPTQPPRAVADRPLSVTRLFESRNGALESPTELVLRDQAAWEATWPRLHRSGPPGAAPAVDFGRDMVVVVALGERPSGGFGVRVDALESDGAGALVRYTSTEPGPDCMTTQALTAPVEAVAVPRVAGQVRFARSTVRTRC